MDPTFWSDRWREGRIGFHEGRANALLVRFAHQLAGTRGVLVPLCGKAEDLAWLAAQGHAVLGVELVEDAVRAFFAEHAVTPQVDSPAPFRRYSGPSVTLLAGDFFATTPSLVQGMDGFYDRAALVALPREMRGRYVRHLRSLLPRGARGLVVTFEYPQERMEGPPFSVTSAELRELYEGAQVELLAEQPAAFARLAEVGAEAWERCFLITL